MPESGRRSIDGAARRNYALLSAYVFFYFFAQAASISLLAIWLTRSLALTGEQTGTVFSANFVAAMLFQPLYGFVSDRLGLRRVVPALIAALVILSGPFFTLVYGPLLKRDLLLGATTGGLYIGITFVAGSYALETYINRFSRRDGFEYSRVRLWGSLGFASAALFSGRVYNSNPHINFYLASVAGIFLLPLILATTNPPRPDSIEPVHLAPVRVRDSLGVLRMPQFWRLMVLILGVTNLYLVYDQQFPVYFASLFPTADQGNSTFGYLNSAQIFVEAFMMFVAPIIVKRVGAKNGLLLATAIMIVRIAGSGLAVGPLTISACKMLHSLELPILVVSVFRYIALHFEARLSATVYMIGFSFGHSLGLATLSPLAGLLFDRLGFQHAYLIIAAFALVFWIASAKVLTPTPVMAPKSSANLAAA